MVVLSARCIIFSVVGPAERLRPTISEPFTSPPPIHLRPLGYKKLDSSHRALARTQLGGVSVDEFRHGRRATPEGLDVLEYFAVTFIKLLGRFLERLEIFRVSREISFWLWSRGGLPVRSGPGRLGGGGSPLGFPNGLLFTLLVVDKFVSGQRMARGSRSGAKVGEGGHGEGVAVVQGQGG